MYACTVSLSDVESAVTVYGKSHICCADMSARVRVVYAESNRLYHSTPSVFERLSDENIGLSESLRYYPYRATFDFECWFDTAQLPSDSDKVHWVARHVPLSVSVASNVPGHEQVQVGERHDGYARRDPKEHRLPTSLCQGRRDVGMRVERDEKRYDREKVSGCCLSSATTRAVDDDVTTDPDRRACRNRVRCDRVRRLRAGRIA